VFPTGTSRKLFSNRNDPAKNIRGISQIFSVVRKNLKKNEIFNFDYQLADFVNLRTMLNLSF